MSRHFPVRPGAGYLAHSTRNNLIANDEFPLLDFKELSQCLQECAFDASEELVSRASSSYLLRLFEQILDTFIGLSPDYCVSTTKNLLKQSKPVSTFSRDNQNPTDDDVEFDDTADSLTLVVFYRAVNMLLQKCGIHDFTLMDLMRPDVLRTQRVLSAVINFARFREEHLHECDQFARDSEEAAKDIKNIEDQNVELANRIDKLSDKLRENDAAGNDPEHADSIRTSSLSLLHKYNSKLEQELIKLQKLQEVFKREHMIYKETKTRLIEKLEDQHFLLSEYERELAKIQGYASTDPSIVRQVVADLKLHTQNAEEQFKDLELSVRNKSRTQQSIQAVDDELRNLIKIVQEFTNDLKMLETAKDNLARQIEELNSKRQTSDELSVHLERIKRQFQKSEEKIVKLRQQALERERSANDRFTGLEQEYDMLTKDRDAKQEKLDKTRKENSEIEVQKQKMRLDFDLEFRNTQSAIAKLNAHIRQYLHDISKFL